MDAMRYQSKPTEVWAIQWDGTETTYDLMDELWMPVQLIHGEQGGEWELKMLAGVNGAQGAVPVPVGHWIVRNANVMNDHWPVEDSYFRDKYQEYTP
jgi:hypothetical protein